MSRQFVEEADVGVVAVLSQLSALDLKLHMCLKLYIKLHMYLKLYIKLHM
jgi:hypothetical protein